MRRFRSGVVVSLTETPGILPWPARRIYEALSKLEPRVAISGHYTTNERGEPDKLIGAWVHLDQQQGKVRAYTSVRILLPEKDWG